MKSSKRFMTKVLAAALTLSMITGTGICASAVEDADFEEEKVVTGTSEDMDEVAEETPSWFERLVESRFSMDTVKELVLEAAVKKMSELSQEEQMQVLKIVAEALKGKAGLEEAQQKVSDAEQAIEDAKQQLEEVKAETEKDVEEAMTHLTEAVKLAAQFGKEQADKEIAKAQAQFEEKKAEIMQQAMEKMLEVNQKMAELQEKLETAKQLVQDLSVGLFQKIVEKTTKIDYVDEGEFSYTIERNLLGTYATVTDYSGDKEDVEIPAYINNIPVKYISLASETIKSVTIPDTANVNGISFGLMTALEEIKVSEDNPSFQSVNGVLYDKSGKKLVAVPKNIEYTIPESVVSIGEGAFFAHSRMTKIEIPFNVVSIGESAFQDCCGLEEIEIPYGVKAIGDYAFAGCSNLKKAKISSSVEQIYNGAFSDVADDFAFYCDDVSSYAYEYAQKNVIKVVAPLTANLMITFNTDPFEDFSCPIGGKITLSAEYVGGGSCEGYTYAFYYKREGDKKWTTKQGFKDNAEVEFVAEFEGEYEFCLKVKDSEGNLVKNYTSLTFRNAFENTTTISKNTIKKGETVTLNCASSVKQDQVAYAVYYKKTVDAKWTTKQNYSENAVVTVKPAKAADYIVCVKAKELNNGTISKKYFNVKVEA